MPPSGVSRLRTSAERLKEVIAEPSTPNKASAAELLRLLSEPQRLPSDATRTSAELQGQPKKASAAREASVTKLLRPLSEPLRLPSDATCNMPWPLSIEPSE